ncbi:hypothetical protein [Acinetobacter brisouii]|uniref:hypothetical protein n=1 Tax=Acinetobacter brisouii TaxID=396323 RepID=UPI00124CE592|nr:hypothetical protein [Acinetobacter brisouii]
MAGGNQIKNDLTLDATNFDDNLGRAIKKLEQFGDRIDGIDKKSTKLEKDFKDLGNNVTQASQQIGNVTQNLNGLAGGLDRVQQATSKASSGSQKLKQDLSSISKEAGHSEAAMKSAGDWLSFYGKSLDSVRPKMDALQRSHQDSAKVTESMSKSQVKSIQNGINARIKALETERKVAADQIKVREDMLKQLDTLQRRANVQEALAMGQAYKTNSSGQLVQRYVGKNASRHAELMAEVEATRAENALIQQQRAHISAVVGELQFRNKEISTAISEEQNLLAVNKQSLAIAEQRLQKAKDEKALQKEIAAEDKRLADQKKADDKAEQERLKERRKDVEAAFKDEANAAKQAAKEKAAADREALRDSVRAKRDAEREKRNLERETTRMRLQQEREAKAEELRMAREQAQQQKVIAGIATGIVAGKATSEGVGEISRYQIAQDKVRGLNIVGDQYTHFMDNAKEQTKINPFLSRTEAIEARLDALTSIGHNDEKIIDATVGRASRTAYLLQQLGFENGSSSDIIKNLYGIAEARQVVNDPNATKHTFQTAQQIVQGSNGKINVSDLETMLRNIGDIRATLTDEGMMKSAAMMEQFKAMGGSGGSGSAAVGTILKMFSLYASGKPLTKMGVQQLYGADVMNDVLGNFNGGAPKNNKEAQQMQQAMKYAGFKDVRAFNEDPVGAIGALRGNVLGYMASDAHYKEYFGQNAAKPKYNKAGKMLDQNGNEMDGKEQEAVEAAAFKRYGAKLGISNRAIDAFLTAMSLKFQERVQHSVQTMKGSPSTDVQFNNLQDNWKSSVDNLKTSLKNLAVEFTPILEQLTAVPKALTSIVQGLTGFSQKNPIVAQLGLITLGFSALKIASAATMLPLRAFFSIATGSSSLVSISGMLSRISGAFGGVSSSAASAAGATTSASAKVTGGFASMASGAASSAARVGGSVLKVLGVLGSIVSWVGWAALAASLGYAVAKWIGDMKVGETTVSGIISNMCSGIVSNFDLAWQNVRVGWNSLIMSVRNDTSQAYKEARQAITEAEKAKQRITKNQQENDPRFGSQNRRRNVANDLYKLLEGKKVGDNVTFNGQNFKVTNDDLGNRVRLSDYKGALNEFTPQQMRFAATPLGNAFTRHVNNYVSGKDDTPQPQQPQQQQLKPIQQGPTQNFVPKSVPNMTVPKKARTPREKIEEENPVVKEYYQLQNKSIKSNSEIDGLLGRPTDLRDQITEQFKNDWMAGKYDINRDQKRRQFALGKLDPKAGWSIDQLNMEGSSGGIKLKDLLDAQYQAAVKAAQRDAVKFSAGKVGENGQVLQDAADDYNAGYDIQSNATTQLKKQYARFEAKNPEAVKDNKGYDDTKRFAMADQAGADYLKLAADTRKINKERLDAFADDEIAVSRRSVKDRAEQEDQKRALVIKNLADQIKALKSSGLEESDEYKNLAEIFKKTQADMTQYQKDELKQRVVDTRSAFDTQMAQWRDYESNIENTLSGFGQQAATDVWDISNGDKKLDVKGFASNMLHDVGGNLFKSAYGGLSKTVMGEGEGTSIFDYGKSLLGGKAASENGLVGKWLNKVRGLKGDEVKVDEAPKTQLDATNQNTSAINRLTQALTGAPLGSTKGGTVADWTQSTAAGVLGGVENVGSVDINNGGTGILDQIGAYGGYSAGDAANPFTPALGGEFGSAQNVLDQGQQGEGGEGGGLFGSIKAGFSSLFSPNGEGGIFSSIKSGFGNLFNSGGEGGVFSKISSGFSDLFSSNGGLMSKIGGSFSSIIGGLGSAIGSLFGGSGGIGSALAGGISGAAQGFASGGVGGAIAGGIAGLFADGGAFGSGGQIHAFAKGGAFTNDIYNSPTLFKFANGGQFGVMGEAGPEAVMPLQRDSSGRLGVAVNGGAMGGGGTMVNIEINVTNQNGKTSESTSSSSDNSNWNSMASKVKSLVQEELVKQQRPGGMLRTSS